MSGSWWRERSRSTPSAGFELVGFVDSAAEDATARARRVPVLGSPAGLARRHRRPQDRPRDCRLLFRPQRGARSDLSRARVLLVDVDVVPRLFELVGRQRRIDSSRGSRSSVCRRARFPPRARIASGRSTSSVATLLLASRAPSIAFIAWRIRRTRPARSSSARRGSAEHAGVHGVEVPTMRIDTDDSRASRLHPATADARRCSVDERPVQARAAGRRDPVGRWLRRTSLDELPQLDQRAARGDVARRPAAVHPLRDRALRSRTTSTGSWCRPA